MSATNGDQRGGQKADLDFAADLFKAADKMRQNVEPSEYKHIVLGLIFLKYVSEAFAAPACRTRQGQARRR